MSQQAARGDRHLWGGLSRFIPPQVANQFERLCAARPEAVDASGTGAPAAPAASAFDLAARVRSSWDS